MPALPDVPNVLKYRIDWTVNGDPMANTVHYFLYSGGPPGSGDLSTMAASAVSDGSTHFAGACIDTVGMSSCEITDLSSPTAAQGAGGTPWVGSASSPGVAPGSAMLINHVINRRYRGGKPRSYMPFGNAASLTAAGEWSSAFIAYVATAWGDWVAAIKASGVGCTITQIVNVSYYHGFTVVTNPVTGRARNRPTLRAAPLVDVIQSHTVPSLVASQRRRNRNA